MKCPLALRLLVIHIAGRCGAALLESQCSIRPTAPTSMGMIPRAFDGQLQGLGQSLHTCMSGSHEIFQPEIVNCSERIDRAVPTASLSQSSS
ncbi:hypothetical protein B0T14DRAFT_512788 [Immersiella caudata]|uniref:Secreted protein n=1 Tax=Immersiella caudata TaxID=314043 RepID=A0AA40C7X9_9PEZI|nr:hypothetical protein B0T14DRAFT_512788 [Immersiella caudata]